MLCNIKAITFDARDTIYESEGSNSFNILSSS